MSNLPLDSAPALSYNESSKVAQRCSRCNAPFAYLALTPNGYALVIESRHHGETHVNAFPLFVVLREVAPREDAPK